jgi:hypothetical protein
MGDMPLLVLLKPLYKRPGAPSIAHLAMGGMKDVNQPQL